MPGVHVRDHNAALVETVRSFVNDVQLDAEASDADLELAEQLREVLRERLQRRRTHRPHLERLSERLPLRVSLSGEGQPSLVPAVPGVRYGLARVLAAAATMPPEDWYRLKVCAAEDCQWVFYDESRNRSRRWCSMEACGNRSKVRSFRQRAR